MAVKGENWSLGALHDGTYTWSATHIEASLAAAADRLSNAIGDARRFECPAMKYLAALHDRHINWQLLAWESGIAWHLAGGQHQGTAATLDEALKQIFACVREQYGFDPEAG